MLVCAVVKATSATRLVKLGKTVFDVLHAQMPKPERLKTWRIDQVPPSIWQMIETGRRRSVTSRVKRDRVFPGCRLRIGNQCVEQSGFAHATLAKQQGGVACEQRPDQLIDLRFLMGSKLNDRYAELSKDFELLTRRGQSLAQVDLVEDDDRLHMG